MKQYVNDKDEPKTDSPNSTPHFICGETRNNALEEAAGVCEQGDESGSGPDCWDWHAKDYARAIRALKRQEEP